MTNNSKAWFCFSTGSFYCDTAGALTQEDCRSVWRLLPTAGCAWIENGRLYVQEHDGGIAYDLGPVAHGINRVSS